MHVVKHSLPVTFHFFKKNLKLSKRSSCVKVKFMQQVDGKIKNFEFNESKKAGEQGNS